MSYDVYLFLCKHPRFYKGRMPYVVLEFDNFTFF